MNLLKFHIISIFTVLHFCSFAQQIELGPLSANFDIKPSKEFRSTGIDSTFIYYTDTTALPFFDDFTTNRIQDYLPDFLNPLTTSSLYYKLINVGTGLPESNDVYYTNQITFRRYYDIATGTFSDTLFTPNVIDVADFSSYPVIYEALDLYPPYYIYDTIGVEDEPDTIWIQDPPYFQDSARQFFMPISDTNKLWLDNYAYHNYRFGVNPRTLGVMTFDGLDENGYPYSIGTTVTNYGDYLTSKPIDLSMNSLADSIYISFLYQAEGFGDIPESSDSLILEFYSKNLDEWIHIWSDTGKAVQPFKMVHLSLTDNNFLSDAFQFRFKNYGGLSGSLDHFHLDMVYLRGGSFVGDTIDGALKDFSFVYPMNSLLSKYTSVPWDHYASSVDNKMTDALHVSLYNGSVNLENYLDGSVEIYHGGMSQGQFTLPGFILAEEEINYFPLSYANSYHDLTGGYQFDKGLSGTYQEFEVLTSATAQYDNYEPNDSTRFIQGFYNYYSYDDASAEAAFGPTGAQARLAIHFDSYEEDSIIGIDFCFVPSVNDVSQNLFLLTVWDDENGYPGAVLYEDDVFSPRSPMYYEGANKFIPYYFIDTAKIPVGTSFFVGWRQLDPERLNLGFDRNIDHSDEIFYSVNGGATWYLSPFAGSALLRPIFSTGMDDALGIESIQEDLKLPIVYPNPTNDLVHISVPDTYRNSVKLLLDGYGRIIHKTNDCSFDLSHLHPGIYFISVPDFSSKFTKVIKR